MRGGDRRSLPSTTVTMLPCHNFTVSTYQANPIVANSVFSHKKAFLVRRLHCEPDLLQDVLGPPSLIVCVLPARRQAGGPSVSQADPQHDLPDLLLSHPVLLILHSLLSVLIQPPVNPQPRLDLRSILREGFNGNSINQSVEFSTIPKSEENQINPSLTNG